MVEMKIGHSGKYPYVEINFFPNGEEEIRIKLPMSKMWYKDLIYEIEKVAEEEKKKSEKYLYEDNRKMMIHYFNMYSQLMEIRNELRKDMEMDSEEGHEKVTNEVQEALEEIKTLRGILPFCSFCKKIRDDKGYWEQVDIYINKHSEADISHSICPECMKKQYPEEE
jgi:hypothetical protein